MNDLPSPGAEWFLQEAGRLREAAVGVGKRVLAHGIGMRFQSFGDGTLGLRIPLRRKPRISTSIELVRCEVRMVGSSYALDIVERSARAEEQAAALFADLAKRLRDVQEEDIAGHVDAALRHWKTVFAARRELLSDEEILGLCGELLMVKHLLEQGLGGDAIRSWTGPERADHDFTVEGKFQIECKTTSPHSERLRVSNEHQMESGKVPLVLACIRGNISSLRE